MNLVNPAKLLKAGLPGAVIVCPAIVTSGGGNGSDGDVNKQTNPVSDQGVKVPASLSATYAGVSTGEKSYDGTGIREDIKSRAEKSRQKLLVDGEEKEFELYKTKHSEYVISADGTKLYKLRYVENQDRIKQQVYASKLYQSVGVRAPEYIAFEKDGKTGYMVEVFEEELYPAETNKKALYKSFIADVWLGNRNGLSRGNTKIDKDGNPVKMSVSGSLGYRASGKPKSEKFGYNIDEIKTMRDYSINPDAAKVLAGMTDEELYTAIEEFKAAYSCDKLTEIVEHDYWDKETCIHNLQNILLNRNNFDTFIKNNEHDKKLHAMGLDIDGNPELANVKNFDKTFSIDQDSVDKITIEDWQILKDRGLLRGGYNIKHFNMLDYTYLAQMTDEEHKTALKRELYKHYDIDDTYNDGIGGADILYLSKIPDDEWERVEKRDLLHAHVKYGKGDFWVYENVAGLAKLGDYKWQQLMLSDFLYSRPKIEDVNNFLEYLGSQEARELQPSVYERTRTVLEKQKEMTVHERWSKGYSGETAIKLISMDNKRWNRMMEITNNFSNVKMSADDLLNLTAFDDTAYDILNERGMLTEAKGAYGLKDLSNLTQEDWENIKKRRIDELPKQGYKDWAYLASLSDEEFKLAQDMHLFDDRYDGKQEYPQYLDGEEIAYIVTSLEPDDWKRFEARDLLKGYRTFNGWGLDLANGYSIVKLAKMTDNDFSKFNNLAGHSMYSSTKFELLQLPEEQYQRIFSRNLFRYLNTHEAWDDYTEDTPILSAMSNLSDSEFVKFEQLVKEQSYERISSMCLSIKADEIGLKTKNSLSELSVKQKREYLQLLLEKRYAFLYKDFIENYNGGALLPKTESEFAEIVNNLVKSVGIDFNPITNGQKTRFMETLDAISAPDSEFSKLNLKDPNFKIEMDYPRDEFILDVQKFVKYMDENERNKVFDYFCFELHTKADGQTVMSGYPALINNGEKLAQIENPQTQEIIKQLKPYVYRYTQQNNVRPDGKYISENMGKTLNDIFETLPELRTIVGKRQHQTHDYTVDVHTLAVLQECINNPQFRTLNKEEQQTLILAALLHDITKEETEIDKTHPLTGAYDAYFILKKLNLSQAQRDNIYELIRNHDFLEQCNKKIYDYSIQEKRYMTEDEQNKIIKKYAYELRSGNSGKIEQILTKADLLSVKRDRSFYVKYGSALDEIGAKLDKEIKKVKSTAIPLPQTRIPKASEVVADGVNVVEKITHDKAGNPIKNKVLYLRKGLDLSQYGFDDGVTANDFYAITHGFDTEVQQSILDALDLPGQTALLSESYVVYSKGNYHVFRPQGFIKNVAADNIGAAYYRDFGSGCKKDVESLLNDYINGYKYSYRNYLPKLIKEKLNISDDEYIELYEQIKNKPMNVIEKENPQVASALKDIFATMEIHKRKFQRNYNEILSGRGETAAVYYVGKNGDKAYQLEDVPEFLRKYAEENNLLVVYFGE